jgi:transcriptional regulator NrdR family protein
MSTATCDNCNDAGVRVWKHRRPTETMTHRREELLCASCHPRMTAARGVTNV